MPGWGSAVLVAALLAGGAVSLHAQRQTGHRIWVGVGSVCFLLSVLGTIYLVATLLLLGGVE